MEVLQVDFVYKLLFVVKSGFSKFNDYISIVANMLF